MHQRHNIIIFKSNSINKRLQNERGFAVMLEVDYTNIVTEYILWPKGKNVIPTTQDRFMKGLDKPINNLFIRASRAHKLDKLKLVFATIVDDERLKCELESLFYHWWATNRDRMEGAFECVHV